MDLFDRVTGGGAPSFALLRREGPGRDRVYAGQVADVDSLPTCRFRGVRGPATLALVPYRQWPTGVRVVDDGRRCAPYKSMSLKF